MSGNEKALRWSTHQDDKFDTAPNQRRYLVRSNARVDNIAIPLHGAKEAMEPRGEDMALAACVRLDDLVS